MILATHALIGAALGKNISNPWIVAIIAVPLHFIMDHFRHGEYLNRNSKLRHTWWKTALDLFLGLAIIIAYIFFYHPEPQIIRNILIGAFFLMMPDLLTVFYWEFHWPFLKKIHDFHTWCHRYPPFSKERQWNFRNARNDIIFSVIAIILLVL